MLVLGIDPGLTRCGVGAVRRGRGRSLELVAVDVIRTPAEDDLPQRLLLLADALEGWLDQVRPDVLAVERVFSQHNVRTVMATAQAAGVAILAGARHGIPVAVHTPSEVKAAVTGSGTADKAQVTTMVTRLLRLPTAPRPADAADALALAICHAWRGSADVEKTGLGRQTDAQRAWLEAAAQARRSQGPARRPGAARAGAARATLR